MKDLKSLTLTELTNELELMGEPKFRAGQIYSWLHVHMVRSIDEMGNIPLKLKEKLKENYEFTSLKVARMQESSIDSTRKYLFELEDGNFVESVFMKYKHGNSVCISSQVGCRMGCKFCASTLDGLERNLKPSEMLDQIYAISKDTGERVSNIVVMGTGEPLDNYDNLLRFLDMISNKDGLNISQRNITVSTCGLLPKIIELSKEKLQITLALSLHATTDEKRKNLMPIANTYAIEDLMEACSEYFNSTGRRISFEYALVKGVNDTDEDARELTSLARPLNCHINLIPVNPIKERDFKRSSRDAIVAFKNKLEKNGINVTIRRELGADIDGACGQLRRRHASTCAD
ncbi:MAG: 23S rRNA (adenine(2503)-C(2))-methyltransferase RlmN [Lachnospiraceae bacterium]|nr:23S rRNA (adenine(2503)-C(2))-methyltransferase RlmN [Lachnospiraceae bacterium]